MTIGIKVTRQDGETWREMVERVAGKYGLQDECLEKFDFNIKTEDEGSAALHALSEWDCADYYNDETEATK